MKQLEVNFSGRGEVKGYEFEQLMKSENGYLYKLTDADGNIHHEVFRHKENKQFDCVSYPKSNSFGVWAWCVKEYEKAVELFESL